MIYSNFIHIMSILLKIEYEADIIFKIEYSLSKDFSYM